MKKGLFNVTLFIAVWFFAAASGCRHPLTKVASGEVAHSTKTAADAAQAPEPVESANTLEERVSPKELAVDFWKAVANADFDTAAGLASFPFDMDGISTCVESADAMKKALIRDPLVGDVVVEIMDAVWTLGTDDLVAHPKYKGHWQSHIERFSAPNARCVVEGYEYHYFLVDFTVSINGAPPEQMGSLTRIRCHNGQCGVAGIDN
ncbi:MAG: hypothetical protein JXX14_00160 [Deltaproteobacteria bacterium]|nr:hypothetical protein [Deltaproteobacteria bacterium]